MMLYLLRHLSTSDNEQGINGSQTDTPLSESGEKQAKDLVSALSKNQYDIFIVSPLRRTIQTIQPFLDTLDNPVVVVEPLTIERDLGLLTNSHKDDGQIAKHQEEQGADRIFWQPPEGESIKNVYVRAEEFFASLKEKYIDKSVLISGHQNFLRNLELIVLKKPIEDFYSEDPSRLSNGEMRVYDIS